MRWFRHRDSGCRAEECSSLLVAMALSTSSAVLWLGINSRGKLEDSRELSLKPRAADPFSVCISFYL